MSEEIGRKALETLGRKTDSRIVELVLRLIVLLFLVGWSFWLVKPFMPIFVWAAALATALYPVFSAVARALGGRRGLAATLVTLTTLLLVVGPTIWIGATLIDVAKALFEKFSEGELTIPQPPDYLLGWPVVGQQIHDYWELAATNLTSALRPLAPQLKPIAESLLEAARNGGMGALMFLASIVVAGFLFPPGPALAQGLVDVARRFDEEHGADHVRIAGATVGAVSRGVIGISVLQAAVGGIAMWLAHTPGASMLTIGILLLGIVQLGPLLLVAPLIFWAWSALSPAAAAAFTVAMLVVNFSDNFLKPFLLGHGLTTPTVVIFIGVIGGMLAHGLIGLFAGPVILAVAWEVARAWVSRGAQKSDATIGR